MRKLTPGNAVPLISARAWASGSVWPSALPHTGLLGWHQRSGSPRRRGLLSTLGCGTGRLCSQPMGAHGDYVMLCLLSHWLPFRSPLQKELWVQGRGRKGTAGLRTGPGVLVPPRADRHRQLPAAAFGEPTDPGGARLRLLNTQLQHLLGQRKRLGGRRRANPGRVRRRNRHQPSCPETDECQEEGGPG